MTSTARRFFAVFLALLATGLLSGGVATTAAAAPGEGSGYPAEVCPTITVSTTTLDPGEQFGIGGVNFRAEQSLTLVIKPQPNANLSGTRELTTVRTGADGSFTTSATLPANARGNYVLTGRGAAVPTQLSDGTVCPADPGVQVGTRDGNDGNRNPDSNAPGTAFTGFNMLWLLLLAAALIVVGIYATRRGRSSGKDVRSIHG